MPLIFGPSSSPTIREIGDHNPLIVLSQDQAEKAEIRKLRIGLMNNMPDSAFRATERQFLRIIGSEPVLQIEPVLLTAKGVPRGARAGEYIDTYYDSFKEVQKNGLDGLIISGANFGNGSIDGLPFWNELTEMIDWAEGAVASTLTSCLATHAVMKYRHNTDRVLNTRHGKPEKIWGIFTHEVEDDKHPLVSGMNSDIIVPHSRWNDISRAQFEKAGHKVLIASDVAGVHLAVSRDSKRVMMQGHPEYDTASLAREYLRDKKEGKTHTPAHYMTPELRRLDPEIAYSNAELEKFAKLKNNWRDSAHVMVARWIALVLKLTNKDTHEQYMEGVDPKNPLRSIRQ